MSASEKFNATVICNASFTWCETYAYMEPTSSERTSQITKKISKARKKRT